MTSIHATRFQGDSAWSSRRLPLRSSEEVRIDRDGTGSADGDARAAAAAGRVEPVPCRRLRCASEVESNLERGEGTLRLNEGRSRRASRCRTSTRARAPPRRELRPYHAVPRGVARPRSLTQSHCEVEGRAEEAVSSGRGGPAVRCPSLPPGLGGASRAHRCIYPAARVPVAKTDSRTP